MWRRLGCLGLILACIAFGVNGCNAQEDMGSISFGAAQPDAGPVAVHDGGACKGDSGVEKLADPSTLPACAPACGGAHCVPGDKVPQAGRSMFATCGGGYCVPDTMIESGGAKPPSCTSLGGGSGVCLSLCVPQVAQNKDALPQATCAADERCAPCTNPKDGTSTHACEVGVPAATSCGSAAPPPPPPDAGPGVPMACPYTGPPIIDPTPLAACGDAGSGAHCLSANLVPAAMTSKLATCAGGYCVPDKLIASGGNFIPATCTSLGGAEGRCQSTVVPAILAQATLPVDVCDANERCAPCTNPVDGTDTGVCKTSCDPGPKKPPVVFAACCGTQGKCAPKSLVPSADQPYLRGCDSQGDVCIPTENIDPSFKPLTCKGSISVFLFNYDYTGVCLSSCLKYDQDLDRGSCDQTHTCVPCEDQNGKPTHAPGCNN